MDEDTPKPVCTSPRPMEYANGHHPSPQITDAEILDLIISILDSPYANFLIRQFVLAAITKMSSRPTTSPAQQERIATLIAGYTTNPDLEIQQRSVEFSNLLALGELKSGVLERMPAPELKATVMGYGLFRIVMAAFRILKVAQATARTSPSGLLKVVICWVGTTSQVLPQTRPGSHRWQRPIPKTCLTRFSEALRHQNRYRRTKPPASRHLQHLRPRNRETRSMISWVYSRLLIRLPRQIRSTRRYLRSVDWEAV